MLASGLSDSFIDLYISIKTLLYLKVGQDDGVSVMS